MSTSNTVRRMLGESVTEALPVVQASRSETYLQCPHCKQEIFEKHSYCENGVDYHSDCKGAIKFPPASAEEKEYFERHWGMVISDGRSV